MKRRRGEEMKKRKEQRRGSGGGREVNKVTKIEVKKSETSKFSRRDFRRKDSEGI